MKKLLSLLSVLTISSSVIPTTIAASTYENKENNNSKLNKKIKLDSNDKKQKNNLEKLKRNKRERNGYCRTNCKDYCPETGQCRFNIQRFFPNTYIEIPRPVRGFNIYIPNNETILINILRVNPSMSHLSINDLVVVSSTTNSAVIRVANPTYNIYGTFTVRY